MAPPNVLWIFVDQLRYHALSCHGEVNVRTPNIDRLAAEGVTFDNAVSSCPVCTPARAAVLTGQYCSTTGVLYLGDLLVPQRRTVAHAFGEAGYRTSYVGKWHLASAQNPEGHNEGAEYWVHPLLRGGFQDWFGFELSNHYWRTRYSTGESMWPPHELPGYQTDGLTDLSLAYLRDVASKGDAPWFHVLSLETPHHGSDADGVARVQVGERFHTRHPAPAEYEARFDPGAIVLRPNVPEEYHEVAASQQAQYCAMIANLDDNVGRLFDWLESTGAHENTLVAFFSDHGELGGSHRRFQKCSAYAESLLVPLIMRLPGAIPAGRRVARPANLVDLFPTCASLCGVSTGSDVQGCDLTPGIVGDDDAIRREGSLSQWFGNPRYHPEGLPGEQWRAIHTDRYTYAVYEYGRVELFDNRDDPYQMENRGADASYAEVRGRLHGLLCTEIVGAGEPVPAFVNAASGSDYE